MAAREVSGPDPEIDTMIDKEEEAKSHHGGKTTRRRNVYLVAAICGGLGLMIAVAWKFQRERFAL